MTKQDKERFFPKVNNIKYIEKEISEVEENIDIHKFILSEATDDEDKESTEVIIQLITEDLEHLKQIKDILEAWEVCMNDNAILDVLKTLAKGESINWHRLPKEKQEILKKGLILYDKQNSNK